MTPRAVTMTSSGAAQSVNASAYNYAWLHAGLHLLGTFVVLYQFFPDQGLTLQKVSISSLFLAAIACFAIQLLSQANILRQTRFPPVAGAVFGLLFVWCLVTIARGALAGPEHLITLLINPDVGGLVWLLPLAALIGRTSGANFLASLLPVFRLHMIVGCTITVGVILVVGAENMAKQYWAGAGLLLLYGAPIILLTRLGKRSDWWLALAAQILTACATYIMVARASFAVALAILILALLLRRTKKMTRPRVFTAAFLIAGLLIWGTPAILRQLDSTWLVDTRSFVVMELSSDFSSNDWMFGRGALGTYFSPYFMHLKILNPNAGDHFERSVVEIGYLHIILKAGIIGAMLYFTALFLAVLRALEIKDRRLGDGLALYFALHLAEMAVIGQAAFVPDRLMLWLLAGFVLSVPRRKFIYR